LNEALQRRPAYAAPPSGTLAAVRRRGWRWLALAAALPAAVAGCGGGDDYENRPRPPAPINVTAAITDNRVRVSPQSFGAGPITLIVSNQSSAAQELSFETEELGGSEPGLRQRSGPIEPRGTATLQVDVREGSYMVRVEEEGIQPASVRVGSKRRSAQQDLLQP
jgi:hypothetical protein